MKANKETPKYRDTNGHTWTEATAKGALVWGSVYTTVTSGAVYVLAPMADTSQEFSDILMKSLVIFPSAGAAKGLLMWKYHKDKNRSETDELERFTSKAHKPHKHPIRLKKAA